jgi:hypothetical protein
MGLNKKNGGRGEGRVQVGVSITRKELNIFYRRAKIEGRSGAAQLAILMRKYLGEKSEEPGR